MRKALAYVVASSIILSLFSACNWLKPSTSSKEELSSAPIIVPDPADHQAATAIIQSHCLSCHSSLSITLGGEFNDIEDLQSMADPLRPGGPLIIAGDPAQSRFYQSCVSAPLNPGELMPPLGEDPNIDGTPFSDTDADLFMMWIFNMRWEES